MKNLYFDEFVLEVFENDTLKVTYQARSEASGDDDREIYESPIVRMNLQPGFEEENAIDLQDLKKGKLKGKRLELLGERLYRILFPEEIHKLFEQALNNIAAKPDERGLRIIIAYPENSRVARWPLETLHSPSLNIWLSTDTRLSLTRKIIGRTWRPANKTPPLKILVVVSSPKKKAGVMSTRFLESLIEWAERPASRRLAEASALKTQQIATLAEEETIQSAPIEVKVLGQIPDFDPKSAASDIYLDLPAGFQNFVEIVKNWKPQVLHFIGHGDVKGEEGRLAFVNPITGLAELVTAKQFSQLIIPGSSLRLVVLQVCKSADVDVQLSLAFSMVRMNIPAVVAMQFEIENYCAVEFVSHFYQELAHRKDVDYAVQLARNHITQLSDPVTKSPLFWSNREFCTPVVYTIKPGTIIDTSPAKFQQVPGAARTPWLGHQTGAEEAPSTYEMLELLQKEIDRLKQTLPGGPGELPSAAHKPPLKGPKTD